MAKAKFGCCPRYLRFLNEGVFFFLRSCQRRWLRPRMACALHGEQKGRRTDRACDGRVAGVRGLLISGVETRAALSHADCINAGESRNGFTQARFHGSTEQFGERQPKMSCATPALQTSTTKLYTGGPPIGDRITCESSVRS